MGLDSIRGFVTLFGADLPRETGQIKQYVNETWLVATDYRKKADELLPSTFPSSGSETNVSYPSI